MSGVSGARHGDASGMAMVLWVAFGVMGAIGLWMITIEEIRNKAAKRLQTTVLLVCGMFAYVPFLYFLLGVNLHVRIEQIWSEPRLALHIAIPLLFGGGPLWASIYHVAVRRDT